MTKLNAESDADEQGGIPCLRNGGSISKWIDLEAGTQVWWIDLEVEASSTYTAGSTYR